MSVAPQVARILGGDPRPPCSDAERRAAGRVRAWLQARGDDAEVHTVWVRPQRLATLGLASALAVVGSLLAVAVPVGGLTCALVATLALATGAAPFPRRATQDVVVAPPGDGPVALIVCAAYCSLRAGLAGRVRRGALAIAAAAVAAAAAARAAGAGGAWLGALQLLPTVVLLAGAGAALDAGLAGWASGESSAKAAAAAVALHDELAQLTSRALSPGLILYGGGAVGLTRRLGRLAPGRGRAVVLEVVPAQDGHARWRSAHPQLRAAAAAAGPQRPALPRPPRLGRLPVIRIGGPNAEETVNLGMPIAAALDAAL